ncbi:hypothetical protein TVAG_351970 [Trichomonas vaginalis G3]|uniref:L-type lectin-like domain-containing protein n=1 Tax=Trichomonas vaginalis (strain ATCC PRA-98 / G3) TaxID=412133 RepID=A2DZT1_TRIV3|nr:carbohydrate binding [Trichomonas vaginalis G3]EAY14149.1 hypothetical protein TVAG_351970 [Trichomonas vaginalis G3]KAI5525159.1 carbohydrate binding [Trichomonas vaginalis G3]|eukprot:XP_001326372.1 hypothetical protein [Trichomonas vaginalis G3]
MKNISELLISEIKVPNMDLNVSYVFNITNPQHKSGFAILFIDPDTYNDEVNGGPSIYEGLALFGTIFNRNGNTTLDLVLLQNQIDHEITYKSLKNMSDYSLDANQNISIRINLTFINNSVTLYVSNDSTVEHLEEIGDLSITVNLTGTVMLITTANRKYDTQIDLLNVDFEIGDPFYALYMRKRYDQILQDGILDDINATFRSKKLNKTVTELHTKFQDNSTEKSIFDIFDIFEELSSASEDMAKYRDVAKLFSGRVAPSVAKVHKRTSKIYDRMNNLTKIMTYALNYTQNIMQSFNNTMMQNKIKFNKSINVLEKELEIDTEEIPKSQFKMQNYFMFAAVFELICLFLFFLISLCRMPKHT